MRAKKFLAMLLSLLMMINALPASMIGVALSEETSEVISEPAPAVQQPVEPEKEVKKATEKPDDGGQQPEAPPAEEPETEKAEPAVKAFDPEEKTEPAVELADSEGQSDPVEDSSDPQGKADPVEESTDPEGKTDPVVEPVQAPSASVEVDTGDTSAETGNEEELIPEVEVLPAANADAASIIQEHLDEEELASITAPSVLNGVASAKTGAEFAYKFSYTLGEAPIYQNADDVPTACYSKYDDLSITITVPNGIEIIGLEAPAGGSYRGTLTINGTTAVYHATNLPKLTESLTLKVRIADNGKIPEGTEYSGVSLSMKAKVTADASTTQLTFERSSSASCRVTAEADANWSMAKTFDDYQVTDDTVTLTWYIETGLFNSATQKIETALEKYTTASGINGYTGIEITDAIPTFKDAAGNDVTATSWKAVPISTSGSEVDSAAETGTGSADVKLTYYNTGKAAVSENEIPVYTRYKVTAVYPRASFKQIYEKGGGVRTKTWTISSSIE